MSACTHAACGVGPRNGFGTSNGHVVYYLVAALDSLSEERASAQPLADADRAAWAVRVLSNHYPGRTYEAVRMIAPDGVTIEQMEVFAGWVEEDLGRLELAARLGVDWHK